MTTMKAWFDYFAYYPIDLNVSQPDIRFDVEELEKMKLECMKVAHQFIVALFQERKWLSINGHVPLEIAQYKTEDGVFIISVRCLHDIFKNWLKNTGRKSQIIKKNFVKSLEEIAITRKRREINRKKPMCCLIDRDAVEKSIRELYSAQFELEWIPFSEKCFNDCEAQFLD